MLLITYDFRRFSDFKEFHAILNNIRFSMAVLSLSWKPTIVNPYQLKQNSANLTQINL